VIEQIKRGDNGGAPGPNTKAPPTAAKQPNQQPRQQAPQPVKQPQPKPAEQSEQEPKPAPKQPSPRRELALKDLTLDQSTLAMKFGTESAAKRPQREPSAAQSSLSDYQAFSRPPGSGAAFVGASGINDHLPNLPDGDITLLNAKANIYASFVRRVAVQVFTQLRSQGWERLSMQQIRQLQGFATIEAILTPTGKFVSARLLDSSGSTAFDAVLNQSVTTGARDPNPPPGALAKDGMIHFIFKARSWSQMTVSRRSGAPIEQRWLLLATGLE
jgi:TonB family protein